MRNLLTRMWRDDSGIVAFEHLLVATIIGLGLVVGLTAVSAAMNAELTETGQAILALNQTYSIVSQSNCLSMKYGSSAQGSVGLIPYYSLTCEGQSPIGILPCCGNP